jgi:polyisoprenoid-binding protein YceI
VRRTRLAGLGEDGPRWKPALFPAPLADVTVRFSPLALASSADDRSMNIWSRSMLHRLCLKVALTALAVLLGFVTPLAAQDYEVDRAHAGISFKIAHLGLSWIQGRFDQFGGEFTIDAANPDKSAFTITINPASIDTNNQKRDDHLRSPDFLNAKQFPAMKFKSTAVRPINGGYSVTGDFTMHGVTKPITLELIGGRTQEMPKGVQRTGFSSEFVLKRADFGIGQVTPMLGDKIYVTASFEGTRK